MKTRNELAQATLEEIQRAGVNEEPSADDLETVLDRMDTVFADLLGRNVVLSSIPTEIPDEQFDHLACILARRVAPRFGLGGDATIAANAIDAESKLNTLARINRGTRNTLGMDGALRPRRAFAFTRISS